MILAGIASNELSLPLKTSVNFILAHLSGKINFIVELWNSLDEIEDVKRASFSLIFEP